MEGGFNLENPWSVGLTNSKTVTLRYQLSIQTITNNSNEDNWRVLKCRQCQHLTSTKQFFFKIVTTTSGLYRWSLENRYPLRCCRLRGFSFFFICLGLFPNRVSFSRVSKWVNNTLPRSAWSGYLSLFFLQPWKMHTGIERPRSCNIAQRISGFHYCTNPLIKASSSRPLLPRPNPQRPWRPWDGWLIDELAVQPFLRRSQDISAKTKMPPGHQMVPCLQWLLKFICNFSPVWLMSAAFYSVAVSTHHPSSLRQRTLQPRGIFGNSRGRFCNLAIRSNILHWAPVTVDIKVARFLKNISAWAFQGFSKKQLYLGSTSI